MHVIIDAVNKPGFSAIPYADFLQPFCTSWKNIFPEDQLSIVSSEPYLEQNRAIELFPVLPARSIPAYRKFYDFTLPSIALSAKADIYFSPAGNGSRHIPIPQVISVGGNYNMFPEKTPLIRRWYFSSRNKKTISVAGRIILSSFFDKYGTRNQSVVSTNKATVIYPGIDESIQPIPENLKNEIRDRYTQGREYFLYSGPLNTDPVLVNLLKGFSAFKKRQHTNMPLLITSQTEAGPAFRELIATYKFRDHLCITENIDQNEIHSIRSAAYAAIFPFCYAGAEMQLLETARSGTAVLCSSEKAFAHFEKLTVLSFDNSVPEEINARMALIFKNENKRRSLVELALEESKSFSWQATVTKYREIFSDLISGARIP